MTSTPAVAATSNPTARKRAELFGHPVGLYLLFATEMWERFSYYGMRAILVLFLIDGARGGAGWTDEHADKLYAWYTGLVYLTPLAGGYLADRLIGTHRSLLIGGSIIAAGHFALAFHGQPTFYLGLLLIIIGTGFFKPNVSTMVGQLYEEGDPRRDGGFTIFYMGINLGALIGTFICGYLGESPQWGWHYGFGAAGVGMVAGLLLYVWGKPRYLAGIGDVPAAKKRARELAEAHRARGEAGFRELPAVPEAAAKDEPLTPEELNRIVAIFVTAFFVIFFWLAFEQAGSSMNIFAARHTERHFGGWEMPASWFQNVNSASILIFGPVFAWLWGKLGKLGREPSTPMKMAFGLFLLGGGFVFLVVGGGLSDAGALVSPFWLVAAYVFHTWGELCLSPVGLSFVTKVAPLKFASLLMGVWFLANFAANLIAGYTASLSNKVARGEVFHVFGGQADFFLIFVVSSWCAGALLLALTPWLNRLIGGKHRGGAAAAH